MAKFRATITTIHIAAAAAATTTTTATTTTASITTTLCPNKKKRHLVFHLTMSTKKTSRLFLAQR